MDEKMANPKRSFRIRSRELEKLEIQSLDFLQDLPESRRNTRRRVKSPVLTIKERRELQKKQQKDSRSRRALERELKSVGQYDDSIFTGDIKDTESSLNSLALSNSINNISNESDNGNPSLQSLQVNDSRENQLNLDMSNSQEYQL
jgi:hypothetical protein